MTLITPDTEEARTEELLLSVQASICELRNALKDLKERAESGEEVKNTDVRDKFKELGSVVGQCHTLETKLETIRSRHSKIAQGGYALDLDAARAEVCCALGRIRACCGAGEVSG